MNSEEFGCEWYSFCEKLVMPSLPFVIGPGHVYSTTVTEAEAQADPLNRYKKGVHYHGLGVNTVKNLYSAIQDPIMIIVSKDTGSKNEAPRSLRSIVAIVDVGNAKEHLLLPVKLTATRIVGGSRMDVNVLSSAYTRPVENLVDEAIAQIYAGDIGVYYAKKEPAALLPLSAGSPALGTDSTISIAKLLDYVNQYFPDVLPEEALRYYGHDSRPEGKLGEDALYKLPVGEDTSPRALLANAFEGIITNDIEKRKIHEYKGKVEMLNAEEQKLSELRAQIKELSFANGKRDTKKIKELQFDANHTANRIATLDIGERM